MSPRISAQLVIQHAECQYRCHAKIRIAKLGRNSSRFHMQKFSNVRYRNAHAELKTKSLHNLAERTSYEHPTIIHATFAPNSPDVYNNVASNFDKRVCRLLQDFKSRIPRANSQPCLQNCTWLRTKPPRNCSRNVRNAELDHLKMFSRRALSTQMCSRRALSTQKMTIQQQF